GNKEIYIHNNYSIASFLFIALDIAISSKGSAVFHAQFFCLLFLLIPGFMVMLGSFSFDASSPLLKSGQSHMSVFSFV
ncbi:TPA: hypothetical protein ACYSB1_002255, partial [Citrobacter braakii]